MPTIPRTTDRSRALLEGRRALDRIIRATDAELDGIVADLWKKIRGLPPEDVVAALREASGGLASAMVKRIADGMHRAAAVASEASATALSSATGIAPIPGATVAETVAERLIARGGLDGLPLSQRIHRMTATYRANLDEAVATGIRNGDGAFALARRLHAQAQAGTPPDPALITEARSLIGRMGKAGGPEARAEAARLAERVRSYAATLQADARGVGRGMRPAWEELAKRIESAATTGRADVLERAVRWWAYDKTQYQSKVIARTEMADAANRATEERARESGLVERIVWHVADSAACPICLALDGQTFEIGDVPDNPHPNCRCRRGMVIDRAEAIRRIVSGALERGVTA